MNSNELLVLKGNFTHSRGGRAGAPSLPAHTTVTTEHIRCLMRNLEEVLDQWHSYSLDINPLVGVYYTRVIAKSGRVKRLLRDANNRLDPNDTVVGAQFCGSKEDPKHLVIHCLEEQAVCSTIQELELCARNIDQLFDGAITAEQLVELTRGDGAARIQNLSKTVFAQIVVDANNVERFGINTNTENVEGPAVISVYKTNVSPQAMLARYGINIGQERFFSDSVVLSGAEYQRLMEQAPFLVAMAATTDISLEPGIEHPGMVMKPLPDFIPKPTNEPVVGVIDAALFDECYFSEWVQYEKRFSGTPTERGRAHGTAVTSIIVDGPALNPSLDDDCGRFRVRHFAVTGGSEHINSFEVMKKIGEIVQANRNIKVWNLSLGSELAVRLYSISPEAALLDRLQYEFGVLFVVAGTNDTGKAEDKRIGAPADSINSIVVNSVDHEGQPAPGTRCGPVLAFFGKPDVAYYGGTQERPMMVAAPYAAVGTCGTSFAAPWITRKAAFLIHKMGLSREIAKALIIDSATGWEKIADQEVKGFGVVPIRIEDVLYAQKDEIKFVISENLRGFETSVHNLPVPMSSGKFPYLAKATLCYCPQCDRAQGVDYTSTEVSLQLGRIKVTGQTKDGGERVSIESIDNNCQDVSGTYVTESVARAFYRKWDNVKHIGEVVKSRCVPRKAFETDRWGIALRVKERLSGRPGQGMPVGLVVTLKNMSGANRSDEFARACSLRGWLVSRVNIDERLNLIEKAEAELEFEDE